MPTDSMPTTTTPTSPRSPVRRLGSGWSSPHRGLRDQDRDRPPGREAGTRGALAQDPDRDAPGDPVAHAVSTSTRSVVLGQVVNARHWHDPAAVVRMAAGLHRRRRWTTAARTRRVVLGTDHERRGRKSTRQRGRCDRRSTRERAVAASGRSALRRHRRSAHAMRGRSARRRRRARRAGEPCVHCVEWAWSEIARGARDHGRDPSSIDVTANVLVRVDRISERARDRVLELLAFWLHKVEWSVIERSGADLDRIANGAQVRPASGPGSTSLITDDVVDTFALTVSRRSRARRRPPRTQYVRAGVGVSSHACVLKRSSQRRWRTPVMVSSSRGSVEVGC